MYTTLISVTQLQSLHQAGQAVRIFDCSSDLARPELADTLFEQERIAGAVQAHLDRHLSAKPPAPAVNGGRHPLPPREHLAHWLGTQGLAKGMQAVVYDRNGGHYCGRLWWILKWLGHEPVAVLDGGLQAWKASGGALESGPVTAPTPCRFETAPPLRSLLVTAEVAARLQDPAQTLIDARAPARFRGEVEPLDPVAGHIPGALNRPFTENFTPDGFFKPAEQLRQEFEALLGQRPAHTVVHHCGSGVTALPNVLAMEIAGLGPTGLYAGSWSEWCNTPGLPCAQGSSGEER